MRTLLGTLTALLILSQPGYTLRQYRCSGRIQYQPCATELQIGESRATPPKLKNTVPAPDRSQPSPTPYVKILSTSFSKVDSRRGVWRGTLRGTGTIEPKLQIFRGSKLESSRAMGAVVLIEQETPFTFNSELPTGTDWSWRIVAQAH
jgi:hypothetical protein